MMRDLARRQRDDNALEDTAQQLAAQPSQDLVRDAAARAVMEALAQAGDARIVVVNVNIQIAQGGGATNQFVPGGSGIYQAGNYYAKGGRDG